MKKNQSNVSKARAADLAEIERLRDELRVAYRALGAYALAHRRGKPDTEYMHKAKP